MTKRKMTRKEYQTSYVNLDSCLFKQMELLEKRRLPSKVKTGIEINAISKVSHKQQSLLSYYHHQNV